MISLVVRRRWRVVKLFASIHGIGTKDLHHVAAFTAGGIVPKDKGYIHNDKRYISDDQRNKMDDHFCVSQYTGHGVISPLKYENLYPFLAGQLP